MQQVICKGIFHYPINASIAELSIIIIVIYLLRKIRGIRVRNEYCCMFSFYVDFAGLT